MNTIPQRHYDASYFAWQREHSGPTSALMDCWKFQPFLRPSDVLLDFGCGGGFLLRALSCQAKYGVEVNSVARNEASIYGNVYAEIEDLPAGILFDVIISHHALEHVDSPLDVLRQLGGRLKQGGKLVFVVPSEEWHKQKSYRAGDLHQHLYTWTPLSLGNLFARAGFLVEQSELLRHRWPPKVRLFYRFLPDSIFHLLCRTWGTLTGNRQIRIVASKSAS